MQSVGPLGGSLAHHVCLREDGSLVVARRMQNGEHNLRDVHVDIILLLQCIAQENMQWSSVCYKDFTAIPLASLSLMFI